MLVFCTCINIHVFQDFCTQTILRQHTLNYFTEQTIRTLCHQISRSIFNLSTGISGISQINTIVHLVTRHNDFVCIDDNNVITTINVRSIIGFVLTAQKLCYFCTKTTQSLTFSVNNDPLFVYSCFVCRNGLKT